MSQSIDLKHAEVKDYKLDYKSNFTTSYTVGRDDAVAVSFTGSRIIMEVYDEAYDVLKTIDSNDGDIAIDVNELSFDYDLDLEIGTYFYITYVYGDNVCVTRGKIKIT